MINIYLDDIRMPPSDGREWIIARTAKECIRLLTDNRWSVDTLSLDHDLGDEDTGYDVARFLEEMAQNEEFQLIPKHILCHSANPVGRANILRCVDKINAARSGPSC